MKPETQIKMLNFTELVNLNGKITRCNKTLEHSK